MPNYNVRFRRRKDEAAADAGLHVKGRLAFESNQVWLDTPKKRMSLCKGTVCVVADQYRS